MTVADYLASELASSIRHEYVAGAVYAMSGARITHNIIATNSVVALGSRLRGQKCRPYNSDMKIRVRLLTHWRFYYPDVSVVCRSNPQNDSFQDAPAVIVEVLSRETERIDEVEKKDAYLTIPSLGAYLLVEQEEQLVVVHRRTEQGFVREVFHGEQAIIPLPEIGIELPLAEIYEGVELSPEVTDENDPSA
jgi:Uma2 family endonuclease